LALVAHPSIPSKNVREVIAPASNGVGANFQEQGKAFADAASRTTWLSATNDILD
jgi:hypothetical protein